MLHLSNKRKRKGKEILNNNLAVLPSHDKVQAFVEDQLQKGYI